MARSLRFVLTLLVILGTLVTASAQSAADPSGHWEGAITLPNGEIAFQVDMSRAASGELLASYSRPDNGLNGFPLTQVAMDGRAISFVLSGNTKFQGVLFSDGTSISGDVSAPIGTAPFNMSRTGHAQIHAAPKSASIAKDFEGVWNGTLLLQGQKLRLVLRMSNQSDGTATATVTSLDQGGAQFPVVMTQKATTLTLNAPAIGGDFFTGVLSPAGDLSGTFSEGPLSAPLTFQRSAGTEAKQ